MIDVLEKVYNTGAFHLIIGFGVYRLCSDIVANMKGVICSIAKEEILSSYKVSNKESTKLLNRDGGIYIEQQKSMTYAYMFTKGDKLYVNNLMNGKVYEYTGDLIGDIMNILQEEDVKVYPKKAYEMLQQGGLLTDAEPSKRDK